MNQNLFNTIVNVNLILQNVIPIKSGMNSCVDVSVKIQ